MRPRVGPGSPRLPPQPFAKKNILTWLGEEGCRPSGRGVSAAAGRSGGGVRSAPRAPARRLRSPGTEPYQRAQHKAGLSAAHAGPGWFMGGAGRCSGRRWRRSGNVRQGVSTRQHHWATWPCRPWRPRRRCSRLSSSTTSTRWARARTPACWRRRQGPPRRPWTWLTWTTQSCQQQMPAFTRALRRWARTGWMTCRRSRPRLPRALALC